MYKIIGADGHEYGLVAADQIRAWIAEGRANAQTLVKAENSTDWKALANFPELVLAPVPPRVQPVTARTLPSAEKKIVAGICGIILGGFGVHKFILGYTGEGITMLLVTLLTCGVGGIVMHIIGIVEGITYMTKSDEDFVATYINNRKGWF